MLASMKRQFTEQLSDIGFVKEGVTSQTMERLARGGSDGLLEASGPEVNLFNQRVMESPAVQRNSVCIADEMWKFPHVLQANCNSENLKLVAAILVAALYPNVVQVMTPESKYSSSSGRYVACKHVQSSLPGLAFGLDDGA